MTELQDSDHLKLKQLLDEARALNLRMFPDQQKLWAAESPLAQEINLSSQSTPSTMGKFEPLSAEFSPRPRTERSRAHAALSSTSAYANHFRRRWANA